MQRSVLTFNKDNNWITYNWLYPLNVDHLLLANYLNLLLPTLVSSLLPAVCVCQAIRLVSNLHKNCFAHFKMSYAVQGVFSKKPNREKICHFTSRKCSKKVSWNKVQSNLMFWKEQNCQNKEHIIGQRHSLRWFQMSVEIREKWWHLSDCKNHDFILHEIHR